MRVPVKVSKLTKAETRELREPISKQLNVSLYSGEGGMPVLVFDDDMNQAYTIRVADYIEGVMTAAMKARKEKEAHEKERRRKTRGKKTGVKR